MMLADGCELTLPNKQPRDGRVDRRQIDKLTIVRKFLKELFLVFRSPKGAIEGVAERASVFGQANIEERILIGQPKISSPVNTLASLSQASNYGSIAFDDKVER